VNYLFTAVVRMCVLTNIIRVIEFTVNFYAVTFYVADFVNKTVVL